MTATNASPTALPRWDMTPVYPSLDAPQFAADFAAHVEAVDGLAARFEAAGVGRRDPAPLDDATVADFEAVLTGLNEVLTTAETLGAYVYAFVATDSRNDLAQARLSELEMLGVRLAQLAVRFTAWVGSFDLTELTARSALAREHAFPLAMAQVNAAHQMSPPEEDLVAELGPSAGGAWGKLHENVTSQIMVPLALDGLEQERPMSEVRNLAHHPDREVRRRAYEAELRAWETHAVPLAAALNGIKGEVNTLSARRAWDDPLDAALHASRIDRQTLDAMLGAAREAFPDFRRYLRAKARYLGLPVLAWYDLFAPVGAAEDTARWAYHTGQAFILEHFGSYAGRLRDFAARAFAEAWIDAEPRPGKVDGGFCMSLRGDESRILVNYQAAYDGVSTLAHELGHAYHNLNEAGLTPLQRQTPMTLAETASIFCETIIREAALRDATPAEQASILEGSLQGTCQVVVDIVSRFLFERRVFAARRERELSVAEFGALMLDAQRETYGDGLDAAALHPFMWAVKGHYYSAGTSFYNYPYMFGLLFGLGLYARYREDPTGFQAGYDDLLAHTGRADAATLAARYGIDLRTPAFWRDSFAIVRADIDRFVALVDGQGA